MNDLKTQKIDKIVISIECEVLRKAVLGAHTRLFPELTHRAGNSCSWLNKGAETKIAVIWTTSQIGFRASTSDIAEK